MTDLDRKNEMITYLNENDYKVNHVLNIIQSYNSKKYENIVQIYRNKLYEIEDLFKQNNLSFYSENSLRIILLDYFNGMLADASLALKYVTDNISELPKDSIFLPLLIRMNLLFMKDYNKVCKEFSNFQFDKHIELVIIFYFANCEYYLPGELTFKYNEVKYILNKLKLISVASKLDNYVLNIIETKENSINNLCNNIERQLSDMDLEDKVKKIENPK